MKTFLICGAAMGWLAVSALGIPQTFQTNVFLNTAGVTFEQFATGPEAWGDATALKGHWNARGDTLTLVDQAAVFGVSADEVTARQQDGHVQSFRVVFRGKEKRAGAKPADLRAQVTANVRAFTGESGTTNHDGAMVFKFKDVTITLRSGQGREVVAEFTKA
jgi:hypothetical protein